MSAPTLQQVERELRAALAAVWPGTPPDATLDTEHGPHGARLVVPLHPHGTLRLSWRPGTAGTNIEGHLYGQSGEGARVVKEGDATVWQRDFAPLVSIAPPPRGAGTPTDTPTSTLLPDGRHLTTYPAAHALRRHIATRELLRAALDTPVDTYEDAGRVLRLHLTGIRTVVIGWDVRGFLVGHPPHDDVLATAAMMHAAHGSAPELPEVEDRPWHDSGSLLTLTRYPDAPDALAAWRALCATSS